jgi:VWFA-related protein
MICLGLFAAQETTIRVDVQLMQTLVTVRDANGYLVPELTSEDFTVQFDGEPQRIAHFAYAVDEPVSIGLLIDTSSSMTFALRVALESARAFIDSMRPRDEAFILSFNDATKTLQDFTQDPERLLTALDGMRSVRGGTDLFAAVEAAALKTRKASYRKRALVVLSDGRHSKSGDVESFRQMVRNAEALVYPVGVRGPHPSGIGTWSNDILNAMADESGGRRFAIAPDKYGLVPLQEIENMLMEIMTELRGQYSIGFYPSPGTRPALGKIRINANNRKYRVRHRQ